MWPVADQEKRSTDQMTTLVTATPASTLFVSSCHLSTFETDKNCFLVNRKRLRHCPRHNLDWRACCASSLSFLFFCLQLVLYSLETGFNLLESRRSEAAPPLHSTRTSGTGKETMPRGMKSRKRHISESQSFGVAAYGKQLISLSERERHCSFLFSFIFLDLYVIVSTVHTWSSERAGRAGGTNLRLGYAARQDHLLSFLPGTMG
ncbi:hypothetical protein CRV24_009182 [Beauveria bassiana]|nr:hypothetical protein CRV24_009182 [Beauveria bassiana]